MLCRTVNANKQPIIDIIKKRVVANPRFGTSDSHIMYYSKQSSSFNMWNVGLLQRGGDCWAWQPKGERAVNEYMWIGKHILGASVINELTPTLNYFNGQSGAQTSERRAQSGYPWSFLNPGRFTQSRWVREMCVGLAWSRRYVAYGISLDWFWFRFRSPSPCRFHFRLPEQQRYLKIVMKLLLISQKLYP